MTLLPVQPGVGSRRDGGGSRSSRSTAAFRRAADPRYVALLHSSGCTSDGHEAAQLYGDDIVPRAAFALVDSGNPAEVLAFLRSNVGLGRDPELRAAMVEEAITHGLPVARQTLAMHCEVAQRFAGGSASAHHPHFTERAFAQSPALAPIGILAGSHHERLDGSGYHRSTRAPALDQAACILAADDCYGAMREARPYRPALDALAAEAELMREAEEGPLDPEAGNAVLAAAGHRVREQPRELPAGPTERELEVLLVLVRGESNQEIAEDLGISAKTVGLHVQHVYRKAGVLSRAAATLWPFEHDLVRTA